MTSTSALGSTQITLQFDLNRNIDSAAVDVQAAMNAATGQLPPELSQPPLPQNQPGGFANSGVDVQSENIPLTKVNDFADNILAQQISQIEGVGLVDVGSAPKTCRAHPVIRASCPPWA